MPRIEVIFGSMVDAGLVFMCVIAASGMVQLANAPTVPTALVQVSLLKKETLAASAAGAGDRQRENSNRNSYSNNNNQSAQRFKSEANCVIQALSACVFASDSPAAAGVASAATFVFVAERLTAVLLICCVRCCIA